MTAGLQADGRVAASPRSGAADPARLVGGSPPAARRTAAWLALRRRGSEILVAGVLAASLAIVALAGAWTSAVARFPAEQPSVAQLEADFATEQARADDLQAQLDSIIAASTTLAGGMDQIGARLGGDTTSAESLRVALAEARARLSALRQALLAAGVPVPTRAPAGTGASAGAGGSGGAAGGAAILPGPGATAPAIGAGPTSSPTNVPTSAGATYPPGVPRSWPSSRPIPPMPSPCVQPQLEDNGVWNCQH